RNASPWPGSTRQASGAVSASGGADSSPRRRLPFAAERSPPAPVLLNFRRLFPEAQETAMFNPRFGTLMFIVLAAAATRLLPHPPNVTAITALALFGGAHFSDRRLAIGVPLLALLVSDLALGFYWQWDFRAIQGHMWVQYASFLAIVAMGFLLRSSRGAL